MLAAWALALACQDPEEWVRRLGSAAAEERDEAERALLDLGDAAVPALDGAAASENPEVATRAARALAVLLDRRRRASLEAVVPPALLDRDPELLEKLAGGDIGALSALVLHPAGIRCFPAHPYYSMLRVPGLSPQGPVGDPARTLTQRELRPLVERLWEIADLTRPGAGHALTQLTLLLGMPLRWESVRRIPPESLDPRSGHLLAMIFEENAEAVAWLIDDAPADIRTAARAALSSRRRLDGRALSRLMREQNWEASNLSLHVLQGSELEVVRDAVRSELDRPEVRELRLLHTAVRLGLAEAVPRLRRIWEEGDPDERYAALHLLVQADPACATQVVRSRLAAATGEDLPALLDWGSSLGVPIPKSLLVDALRGPDETQQGMALGFVCESGRADLMPYVVRLLGRSPDFDCNWGAYIGDFLKRSDAPLLLSRLSGSAPAGREHLLDLLVEMDELGTLDWARDHPAELPVLRECQENLWPVSPEVAAAILRHAGSLTGEDLRAYMRSVDAAQLDSPEPLLRRLLRSGPSELGRRAALRQGRTDLLRPQPPPSPAVAPAPAIPLSTYLASADPGWRCFGLRNWIGATQPELAETVIRLLDDFEPGVRRETALALLRNRVDTALPQILELGRDPLIGAGVLREAISSWPDESWPVVAEVLRLPTPMVDDLGWLWGVAWNQFPEWRVWLLDVARRRRDIASGAVYVASLRGVDEEHAVAWVELALRVNDIIYILMAEDGRAVWTPYVRRGVQQHNRNALDAALRMREPSLLGEIPELLKERRSREFAVKACLELDARDHVRFLSPLLDAADPEVRIPAAVTLACWGDAEGRAVLERMRQVRPGAYRGVVWSLNAQLEPETMRRLNRCAVRPLPGYPPAAEAARAVGVAAGLTIEVDAGPACVQWWETRTAHQCLRDLAELTRQAFVVDGDVIRFLPPDRAMEILLDRLTARYQRVE